MTNHLFLQLVFMLVSAAALAPTVSCQGAAAPPLAKRVEAIAERYAAGDNFSGAVLLAQNGKPLYQKSFGFADRAGKTPFREDTPSSIASIGKILTSALILKLADEKRLALTDPIAKFLPATKIPNADRIMIHQLLTHTSGLGNYMAHPDYANLRKNAFALDDLIVLVASQPLVFETPGARHEYSNSGYIVLGKIIETVTKKKYADALDENILKPLKMKNTRLAFDRENFRGAAQGYFRANPADEWRSTAAAMPTPSADGGIFTTAGDLFAFDRALFGGKILRPETFESMKKRHVEANVPGLGKMLYGYGLMTIDYEGGAYSVGHNGGSPGYGAEYRHYFIGRDEYTLIVISNYDRRIRPLLGEIQTELLKSAGPPSN
jgi:CubicO group peptidase (beta-lactamase class C family)